MPARAMRALLLATVSVGGVVAAEGSNAQTELAPVTVTAPSPIVHRGPVRAHGVEAWVFDALLVRQTVMMRCHETAIVHTGPAARVNHARTPYACARARRDRRGR